MKSQGIKKVFVGLSGGVDSAVSAAILSKAGYKVTGVFIKVWQPDWIECNWKDERREAMRVSAHLGIPFVTLDLEKEYKESVIDHMVAEYKAGRTPNPDVMCNALVKFGAFWRWAKSQGADYIATGHYARVVRTKPVAGGDKCRLWRSRAEPNEDTSSRRGGFGAYKLLAGIDHNKDQSYFLWTLNQEDLAHILFPVGHLTKPEVRKLARKFKLPNADKKDSQGLCFIGKVNVKDFLAHYIDTEPGNILNESGEIIGKHPGALFFTIGERHGFMIDKKTPNDERLFVIDKDMEQNTITVSDRKSNYNSVKTVRISNINWITGVAPSSTGTVSPTSPTTFPRDESPRAAKSRGNVSASSRDCSRMDTLGDSLQARSRYRQPLQNIKIHSINIFEMIVEFERPQDTLTPGQSLVIYHGEECVGGGIIIE